MQITGRTLRQHLMAYSTLTLLLTLGMVVVVAWFPLNKRILAGVEESLGHETAMRARVVDEALRRGSDLAWQISSRTAARITTAEADLGLIDPEEARQQLFPRLRDALEFNSEAKGLLRLNRQGQVLVRIGPDVLDTLAGISAEFPILEQPPVRYASRGLQGISRIIMLGQDPHVIFITPVFSPDERVVARDLLLYRLAAVMPAMSSPLSRGQWAISALVARAAEPRNVEFLLLAGRDHEKELDPETMLSDRSLLVSGPVIRREGGLLLGAVPITSANWWLVVGAQRWHLMGEARSWLATILFSVLGLGVLGLLGSLLLMRPLRDKILVAQDDLRRQVAELERTRAKLGAQSDMLSSRNEDLRHFAYASAHDLKSPLISIGGHAQMLLDWLGPQLPPERRQSLEFILAGTKRMFQHVNDMLDYSRAAELEPRLMRLSLDRLCQEILLSLDARIRESRAQISIREVPEIFSDRRLLRMILHNLVDNALCYRQPDRTPEIEISADLAPHEVVIQVRDNGLGIAPDHQPQVFETFYRLHDDANIPGTGLGLAICLRAVQRLEGSIELESEPGMGSCFTVRLPQPPPEEQAEDGDEPAIS